MDLLNKNVLVIGLGISGLSTIKALHRLGAKISISDSRPESEFTDILNSLSNIEFQRYFNVKDLDLSIYDLIIKSPGIPPSAELIKKALVNNIEIITDIELSYRISPTKNIIAITGTNGKTTTTTLVGDIFKKSGYKTYLAGNIGIGILDHIIDAEASDVFVVETSSFQLEHIVDFKPKVSLILNISPDHINWHGSYENYIAAKLKIFMNQDNNDYLVLNYDDEILRSIESEANIIYFSTRQVLEKGVYLDSGNIVIDYGEKNFKFMPYGDLKLIGRHNIENVLGAIGVSIAMGLDISNLRNTLLEFKGVEHRLEYVTTFNGLSFYNDSKGTNPESTIMAIESFHSPIILIAGGYNKESEFDQLILSFNGRVKELILFGETKELIKAVALSYNYNSIHMVDNMDMAVNLAYELGSDNDNILLSPACASWDMYKNFEERGVHFKNIVNSLREGYYAEIKRE